MITAKKSNIRIGGDVPLDLLAYAEFILVDSPFWVESRRLLTGTGQDYPMNQASLEEANGLWRLYHQLIKEGKVNLALRCARQGVHICCYKRDIRQAGIWQRMVANCLYLHGKYEQALAAARRGCEKQPDVYERALSHIQVGSLLVFNRRYEEAFRSFEQAAAIAEQFPKDAYLWMHFYGNRAIARKRSGDFWWALIDWEGAADVTLRAGMIWRAAGYTNNIGVLLAQMGKLESSERRLRQALAMLADDPHPHTHACVEESLGYLFLLKGDHINAFRLLRKAADAFTELGDNAQLAPTLLHLAELHEELRGYSRARDEATRALKLARKIKNRELAATALEILDRLPRFAEEPEFVYLLTGTGD